MATIPLKQAIREKRKKFQSQWIILLCISALLGIFFVGPKFYEWQKQVFENNTLGQQVQIKNRELEVQKAANGQLLAQKQELNQDLRAKEAQIFPTAMDNGKIAETLELLALTLSKFEFSQEETFVINSLNFSEAVPQKGQGYKTTRSAMSMQISLHNLKDLIRYLQTGNLPERVVQDQQKSKYERVIDQESIFIVLEKNLLPLATIDQLQYSAVPKKDDLYDVQMTLSFYSQ